MRRRRGEHQIILGLMFDGHQMRTSLGGEVLFSGQTITNSYPAKFYRLFGAQYVYKWLITQAVALWATTNIV